MAGALQPVDVTTSFFAHKEVTVSDPFLGQISLVGFTFAPRGFAECNGQLLPINQNQALFALLGTMYGGDGRVNFALPNLQGRAPVHATGQIQQGQTGGEESHALVIGEVPAHSHNLVGSANPATSTTPAGNVLAAKAAIRGTSVYSPGPATQPLDPTAVANAGGGQAHLNLQPMLTILFIIAIQGIFPSRN
jgi:microcystin-dependent protein